LALDLKDAQMADSPIATTGPQGTSPAETVKPVGQAPAVDTNVPQTARIWNYLLGGKDNYAVDRAVGDEIKKATPELVDIALLSRAYLARAVRYLAGEAGIRQFLDIGSGLPAAENTHEVAQAVAPDARIVYVDNDPLVQIQAQALLTSSPEGATDFVLADLRDPAAVLKAAARTLDFEQPIALLLMGVLGHIEDDDEAKSLINGILEHLPSGSYLAMYDGGDSTELNREVVRIWNLSANPKYHLRSPERFAALFDGLELVEPGVGSVTRWRPDTGPDDLPDEVDQNCAVGRKP
jgi:O-methyltransferase involved in polyketide biosynthesis